MMNEEDTIYLGQMFLERVYSETGVSEEDVLKVFDQKSASAGFFKRGVGKKLRRQASNRERINNKTRMVVGCYEEQHKEKIDHNPLAVIEGFFCVNGGTAEGVLLIYEDKAFLVHIRFGASFGLVGLALNARDMVSIMPIELPKLVDENPLTNIKPFNYLKYGRYAFYVYSPYQVIYGLLLAKKIVSKQSTAVSGSEIVNTANMMSI